MGNEMAAQTMRIKMNQSIAGHRTATDPKTGRVNILGTFSHDRGDEIDWDAIEAKRFIERGIASAVKS